MESLEAELERARGLEVAELADAIETIGFECTRCGACCKSEADDPHTATVFPDEVRALQDAPSRDPDGSNDLPDAPREWRDVARPMPYGVEDGAGETFEWALQTDACGDCTFYEESEDGTGACSVHADRPLICETYPFSVALGGTSQPMGEPVDSVALGDRTDATGDDEAGAVRAHECEGLGREISREDAEELAAALKARAVRELREAIGVRDAYEPIDPDGGVVVHDSEGAKRPDGSTYDG
ncbi:YkgJ family cysteine cluster protein [Halorussus marinus]|uniref:YkgJ family cysteine cluster protein n=1 Tax=Halorussus marinus TaxID=2505976 RepID=UPI00106E9FAD|nr:YkgJ family cysteine cluster protein [Halorussus marinus]